MATGAPRQDRGHTDQLTGSLHLFDMPANALFQYALKCRLPRPFLPSFLHEATHFWCEATDLGGALALLELRAHREVMLARHTKSRLMHDIVVADGIHLLLKPLLEGMALFVEFDAGPGHSKVFAEPDLWAGAMFVPLDEDPPKNRSAAEWMTDKIFDAIVDYRTGSTALRRRTEILMQPLMDDSHFYLSGYLTVKHLWQNAAILTPIFQDRDFFLVFLRYWIFQDWILIGHLLNEEISPAAITHLVSVRLQQRLNKLGSSRLSREATVLERHIDSGQVEPEAVLDALHLGVEESQATVKRMRSLIEELTVGAKAGGDNENLFLADIVTLDHRQDDEAGAGEGGNRSQRV